jgi:Rrf2 family protein
MLALPQRVGYAMKAMACMASGRCATRFVREIAACADVPAAYLAKIFKRLADAGLITAKRGWSGGSRVTRPPEDISLREICVAVEGQHWLPECLLGFDACAGLRSCPTRAFWKKTRRSIEREMERLTLADLVALQRTSPDVCRSATTRRNAR